MRKPKVKEFLIELNKRIDIQKLISRIDKEILSKILEDKNKLILVSIVILIILYVDFSFGLKSQMRALGMLNPKIVRLRRDLKNLNADLNRMMRAQGKGEGGGSQIRKLVSAGEIPWVIEEISRLANQQDVKLFQIKPSRSLAKAKSIPRFIPADRYSPVQIDLEISAGYHQLGRFLSELENHAVFLEIQELDIKQSQRCPFEHKIKLKLKTLVANE